MEQRVSGEWKRRKVRVVGILRFGETARCEGLVGMLELVVVRSGLVEIQ
jgi:hypothetical protein